MDDTFCSFIQERREARKEKQESIKRYNAIMAILAEILSRLASIRSYNNPSTFTDECIEFTSIEACVVKKSLEPQVEEEELRCELQQMEIVEYIELERGIESLGEVEQETDSIMEDDSAPTNNLNEHVEPSSFGFEIDVEEDCAQLPKYILSNEDDLEKVGEQGIEFEKACQEVELSKRSKQEWRSHR
ncbi:hypothetical protein AHAS_Ahas05G0025100 [Arachis hypogaea]